MTNFKSVYMYLYEIVLLSELKLLVYGLLYNYCRPSGSWSSLKYFHRKGIKKRKRKQILTLFWNSMDESSASISNSARFHYEFSVQNSTFIFLMMSTILILVSSRAVDEIESSNAQFVLCAERSHCIFYDVVSDTIRRRGGYRA